MVVAAVLTLASCHRAPHLIADRARRAEVHTDFESRKAQFPTINALLNLDTLRRAEREAMEFLYAYMPLCDLADYPPDFHLASVRATLAAREEMPWAGSLPEEVFLTFVLPTRVNNENLDSARQVFFHELKGRVKGLTMEEAALEVNHWCHEHVAYRASDSRTSAPLATLRTALGRCGEESTFAVAALRAVGIPARQCYTPRWAHCDDNHAWVEVYVDGQWRFMGGCEPDPRLDMGWFAEPATRCMMVHTKAFGRYRGDEEVVRRTTLYSELNLLPRYAPTRHVTVTVQDPAGRPVPKAEVRFQIYNYAEYYTIATVATDNAGHASLTTGLGDMLVWATDGGRYAFEKMDVRNDSTLTLTLADTGWQGERLFEMVPPVAGNIKSPATEEERAANAQRLAREDSLRNAYTATFHANSPNPFVRKAEGNWAEIERFLSTHPDASDYLATFSDKDLRDITAAVLEAHYTTGSGEAYRRGILPARISDELVRPYRQLLGKAFTGMTAEEIRRWVADSITLDEDGNYCHCPISPTGVYALRRADSHSRDIFFVAACRSAEVPAYLDNATQTLYTWDGSTWQPTDVSNMPRNNGQASLTLVCHGAEVISPVYWTHFTLSKLEHGALRSLDFEDDSRMASFPTTLTLEPGVYCLSTGNRYPDGAVRSRLDFFELKAGETLSKEIVILPLTARAGEYSTINPHLELFNGVELWDYAGGTGMLYVNLGDYGEPSKHLVVEMKQLQKEMRQWGGMTFMVGPSSLDMTAWKLANTDIAYHKGMLEQHILTATKSDSNVQYPIVTLIDKHGISSTIAPATESG